MKTYPTILLMMALAAAMPALKAADPVLSTDLSPSVSDAKISVPSLADAVTSPFDFPASAEVAVAEVPASLATTAASLPAVPAAAPSDVQQSHFRIAIYTPGSSVPEVVTDASPQVSDNGISAYAYPRYWCRLELRNGYIAAVSGYGYGGGGISGYSGNRGYAGYSNYGYGGYGSGTSVYVVNGGSSYRAPGVRAPVSTWYLHN